MPYFVFMSFQLITIVFNWRKLPSTMDVLSAVRLGQRHPSYRCVPSVLCCLLLVETHLGTPGYANSQSKKANFKRFCSENGRIIWAVLRLAPVIWQLKLHHRREWLTNCDHRRPISMMIPIIRRNVSFSRLPNERFTVDAIGSLG